MNKKLVAFIFFAVTFISGKANSQNINDTIFVSGLYKHKLDTIPIGKIDTIQVRLLLSDICDTSSVFRVDYAFVINGYEVRVRKKYTNEPGTFCYNCPNYWQHLVYLDEKKKVLKDCIEVWLIK